MYYTHFTGEATEALKVQVTCPVPIPKPLLLTITSPSFSANDMNKENAQNLWYKWLETGVHWLQEKNKVGNNTNDMTTYLKRFISHYTNI